VRHARGNIYDGNGVYMDAMFEQSILTTNSRNKSWTMAVSLVLETSLILIAALIPLIYTDQLPGLSKWAEKLVLPPAAAPAPPAEHQSVSRRAPSLNKVFTAPAAVPPKVRHVIDDPAQFAPQSTSDAMVVGSVVGAGNGDVLSHVLNNLIVPRPQPPPTPAAPKPTATAPVRVSGTVQEARILRRIMPIYPPLAITARVQGTVHLVGVIARDGTIRDLQVIDGHPMLVRAAVDAVRQWIYKPTLLSGEAVEVMAPITVTFKLDSAGR
jgi:protein TonB